MRDVEVRQPLLTRLVVVALLGGFVVYVAVGLVWAMVHGEDTSGAPPAIIMAAFAGFLGYRLAALSLCARGQVLVVRNYWRTRHVALSQVQGLDIGRASAGRLRTVRIITSAGAIPIDILGVTGGMFPGQAVRRNEILERRRQELTDWIGTARPLGQTSNAGEDSSPG